METLYTLLKNAETINNQLSADLAKARSMFAKYSSVPGFINPVSRDIRNIDVGELQKKMLAEYEENPVFYDAISGKKRVEQTLLELSSKFKGIKSILPAPIDTDHNQKIDHIGELITTPEHLRTRGVVYPDNPVATTAYILAVLAGMTYIMPALTGDVPDPLVTSTIGGGVIILTNMFSPSRRPSNELIEEARYVDSKIKEFYLCKK